MLTKSRAKNCLLGVCLSCPFGDGQVGRHFFLGGGIQFYIYVYCTFMCCQQILLSALSVYCYIISLVMYMYITSLVYTATSYHLYILLYHITCIYCYIISLVYTATSYHLYILLHHINCIYCYIISLVYTATSYHLLCTATSYHLLCTATSYHLYILLHHLLYISYILL